MVACGVAEKVLLLLPDFRGHRRVCDAPTQLLRELDS